MFGNTQLDCFAQARRSIAAASRCYGNLTEKARLLEQRRDDLIREVSALRQENATLQHYVDVAKDEMNATIEARVSTLRKENLDLRSNQEHLIGLVEAVMDFAKDVVHRHVTILRRNPDIQNAQQRREFARFLRSCVSELEQRSRSRTPGVTTYIPRLQITDDGIREI